MSAPPNLTVADVNGQDPNFLLDLVKRIQALEKQIKELPDTLPPTPGLASGTKRGLMSKEQAAAIDASTATLTRTGKGARVWRSTAIVVTTSTPAALGFDTTRYDDASFFNGANPTRLTVPTGWDGKYTCGVNVSWSGGATGARILQIRHTRGGTSTIIAEVTMDGQTSSGPSMAVGTGYAMQAGDYIEMVVNQTSGANRTIDTATDKSPVMWLALGG